MAIMPPALRELARPRDVHKVAIEPDKKVHSVGFKALLGERMARAHALREVEHRLSDLLQRDLVVPADGVKDVNLDEVDEGQEHKAPVQEGNDRFEKTG
jgi:hypothetical protein